MATKLNKENQQKEVDHRIVLEKLLKQLDPPSKAHVKSLLRLIAEPEKAHDIWWTLFQSLPNPDRVLVLEGQDSIRFYDAMVDSDSVVNSLLNTRSDEVVGLPWHVMPASSASKDIEIAQFAEDVFREIDEFENDLEELMGALRNGYAISEIIWEDKNSQLVINALKSRRPDRFKFNKKYELVILTRAAPFQGVLVPPNKFVIHRHRPRYENPYGVSALRSVYWPWKFKHEGFQWWVIAAERNAVPTVLGKYKAGASPDEQDELMAHLLAYRSDNAIIAEIGTEIELITGNTDPQLNEKLRDALNEEISWGLIGSTHATSTGAKGGGSFALAKEHGSVRQDILQRDARRLMATINKQLIEPLVLFNYGPQRIYPKFKIHYEPPIDRRHEVDIIDKAVRMGISVDELAATEAIGIKTSGKPQIGKAIELPESGSPQASPILSEYGEKKYYPSTEFVKSPNVKMLDETKVPFSVKREAEFARESLYRLSDAAAGKGVEPMEVSVEQFKQWLISQNSLQSAVKGFYTWSFDSAPLVNALTETILWGYLWGYHDIFKDRRVPVLKDTKNTALKSLLGLFNKNINKKLQEGDPAFTSVRPEEAIEIFGKREILERGQFDLLHEWARSEAFTAAGQTLDTLRNKIQPALMEALTDGMTLQEFSERVGDLLLSPHHVETVFRTNIMSAYNTGRADAVFDPLIADLIPAVQFMAVVDDRTTEVCLRMNGKVVMKGDMLIAQITPPLHFNCRSTIVPVFIDEMRDIRGNSIFRRAEMQEWPETAQPLSGFGWFTPVLNQRPVSGRI